MEGGEALVGVMFGSGDVPKVKRKSVTIVTQCVALETTPLPFVADPQLVDMVTLEFNGLLIGANLNATYPSFNTSCLDEVQPFTDFPIWINGARRNLLYWILNCKESAEVLVSSDRIWSHATVNKVVAIYNVLALRLEFHTQLRRWGDAMQHPNSNMLTELLDRKWFPIWIKPIWSA